VLDAECARQYLRLCSETLSHWLLAAPNSQRHTPHEQRKPPARLFYRSWLCLGDDDAVPRFRSGKGSTFFLVVIQHLMHARDKERRKCNWMGLG
jgi:hypothetical protein